VAAQSKRGRLGFFSDPQKVDFNDLHSENVQLKMIKKQKPVVEEVKTPTPPPAPAAPPPTAAHEVRQPHYLAEWRPSYVSINSSAGDGVKAKLQGFNPFDLGFHADEPLPHSRTLRIDAEVATAAFKPHPADQYPNQAQLAWPDVHLTGVMLNDDHRWGYGGTLETAPQFARQDSSSIKAKLGFVLGPTLENWCKWNTRNEYYGDYSLLVGTDFGARTSQSLRFPVWEDLYGGVTLSAEYLTHSGGSTTSLTGQISLGWEF
jgi:hypothetical protein